MKRFLTYTILLCLCINCSKSNDNFIIESEKWIAIHLLDYTNDEKLEHLGNQLPELAEKGLNTLFLEIDYHFDFKSHPELVDREEFISLGAAKKFKQLCNDNNIRLIPQFQSLGHQSWAQDTYELLTVYPELDLTPGAYPNNKDIYCREWDPYNPKVNEIVFALIDEILDAFDAQGLHLGMDEIFLITSPFATSTKDKDPAMVFAKVVNDFHDYFTKQKGVELFIWGDRLIDGETFKYGEWEASLNGTAPAIDLIPKDIVICDWHYEPASEYLSVPMFINKGFRVLPTSWRKIEGVKKLINYTFKQDNEKMLGHLFSTWGFLDSVSTYKPFVFGSELIKSRQFYEVQIQSELSRNKDSVSVTLTADRDEFLIFYTTDGSEPSPKSLLYKTPFKLNKPTTVKAVAYNNKIKQGGITSQSFATHKGLKSGISSLSTVSEKYNTFNGSNTLNDGQLGSTGFNDGKWIGFEHTNFDVIFEFEQLEMISNVSIRFINQKGQEIVPPKDISIFSSSDGKNYQSILSENIEIENKKVKQHILKFKNHQLKFLKINATNRKISSKDSLTKSWIFIDEVIIN